MFSKKTTKFDKIFTVDLTLCSKYQIDGEDFVNFCGLLRKHELYKIVYRASWGPFIYYVTIGLDGWVQCMAVFAYYQYINHRWVGQKNSQNLLGMYVIHI